MFFGSVVDALLPGSVHLTLLLLFICVMAFRRPMHSRRYLLGLVALIAWSWFFSTPAIANRWVRHLEGEVPTAAADPARDDQTLIVVLASGEVSNRGGPLAARLDGPGMARLTAGVALWRKTGGRLAMVGGLEPSSVARTMVLLAREWGVPDSAMLALPGSTRTQEDLQIASPVVRAHRGPVWLVTSALHMPRALATAERLGLQMQPHRCDYRQYTRLHWGAWLPNAGAPATFAEVLHEELGLLYYRWRRWA